MRTVVVGCLLLCFCLCVTVVSAHSWVACTDYGEQNGQYWDASKCKGYARRYSDASGGGVFGADAGFNYQNDKGACRDPPRGVDADYTTQYPYAKYSKGQKVCLAWPSKNHVADTCTNPYIPDGGVKIFSSGVNPTTDPTQDQFKTNLVADLGAGGNGVIDHKGYQNCPKFCENTDKSLCTGCFTVPADLADGIYTFQWYWIFNAGSAPYTTCWEAQVGTGNVPPPPTPAPTTSGGTPAPTSPSTQRPLDEDEIALSNYPQNIPPTGSFTVKVDYYVLDSRQITIDLLSNDDFTWYGKGTANVNGGKGSVTITVNVQNAPPNGKYILKGWIVSLQVADTMAQPWLYELNRVELPVAITDSKSKETAQMCTQNSDCKSGVCTIDGVCTEEDNSDSGGIGAGGAAAIVFALLFAAACAALFAGYYFLYKNKQRGGPYTAYNYRADNS